MSEANLTVPVGEGDHSIGPDDAPVTLVEYGDFECPHCRAAHPIVKSVIERMGDRLRFVYRHFPITSTHPHAQHAAEAAEAAGAQGQFWAMHDLIFENQEALEDDDLISYAEKIGIDASRVATELAEGTHEDKVRNDFRSGVRSGVNGTPTFFINGARFDGSWHDEDGFVKALEAAAGE